MSINGYMCHKSGIFNQQIHVPKNSIFDQTVHVSQEKPSIYGYMCHKDRIFNPYKIGVTPVSESYILRQLVLKCF